MANAFTEIRYRMTLVALPCAMTLPNGRIPVRFIASGEADAHILSTGSPYGASFNASATYEALFDNQSAYIQGSASAGVNGFGNSFLLDQIVQLLPGAQVLVILNASVQAGSPGGDPTLAHAFVDPQYLIDPAFAAFYDFDGLPIAQVPPTDPGTPGGTVPEPSTWLLMLAGVGAAVFRRSWSPAPSPLAR